MAGCLLVIGPGSGFPTESTVAGKFLPGFLKIRGNSSRMPSESALQFERILRLGRSSDSWQQPMLSADNAAAEAATSLRSDRNSLVESN